ncbi:MAG: hypothetical protein Q7S40_17125 [Opitutaceae bacterium]|nr:hypothetical protein [Opitutaceae bacterium]
MRTRPAFTVMIFRLALAAAAFATAGCTPTPLMERKIPAESSSAFASWQGRMRGDFNTAQWADFEEALQEIKLKLMADNEASGTDKVNEVMRSKINGRTVREVLQLGYTAKLWRFGVERSELERMIKENATLLTKPGDTASAEYLERKHRDQTARLNKVIEQIRVTQEKLGALEPAKR